MSAAHTIISAQWSGVLPPPSVLEAYQRHSPKAVDIILTMAQDEQTARHKKENNEIELVKAHDESRRAEIRRGQYISFLAILSIVAGAVTCAFLHEPTVGCAIVGIGVVNLVGSFIGRKG